LPLFCALLALLAPGMLRAVAAVLRPPPPHSPSEFAAEYRDLKEGTTSKPGKWSNEVFPYLTAIMDAVAEAIRTGKRGVVLMKSGQGGGSEAMINVLLWMLVHFVGPILYLISKDDLAREFSRERFDHANKTCPPVAAKHLSGTGSDLLLVKRYVDGVLRIQGGRSILNLQSLPYRVVFIDEVDSLQDEVEGHGDPIKIAEIRTDAQMGDSLIVAFAHPSTRDRGAGKLYYEQSDQRRGFVDCFHCGESFWLTWDHVEVFPGPDQTPAQAVIDPNCYAYVTPCCGAVLSDAQRFATVRKRCVQRTTLDPETAAKKNWIGLHFGQLYMSNKPLAFLAEKWIEGLDDDSVKRVVVNKRWGDVFDPAVEETLEDEWKALRGEYTRGEVPSWCRFLTAGQDSRTVELHWCVWGWGLRRNSAGQAVLCGALVDYGVVPREHTPTIGPEDLEVFDQILYGRTFTSEDGRAMQLTQGMHDSGWQPVAVYEYSRTRPRAHAVRGGAEDEDSDQPPIRWTLLPDYVYEGADVKVKKKMAVLNTFAIKTNLFGLVKRRLELEGGEVVPRLTLPSDVSTEWVAQASSEQLVPVKRKKMWKAKGPNHWSDCNVYALGSAVNLAPLQRGRTQEEQDRRNDNEAAEAASRRNPQHGSGVGTGKAAKKKTWPIGRRR